MNCARAGQLLDASLDGELDERTSAEVDRHAAACAACAALREERTALTRLVRSAGARYDAPEDLSARVSAALRAAAVPRARARPTWTHAVALAACAAFVSAIATFWIVRPADDPLREAVVVSHVAALAQERALVAVESSDRHVVKPWFQGRVDFAPTVKDVAPAGFVLIGGRVDHIAARPAAAVVYRIRSHVVELFVWRAGTEADIPVEMRHRGFNIVTWVDAGLRYSAISDVGMEDLRRFGELVRGP